MNDGKRKVSQSLHKFSISNKASEASKIWSLANYDPGHNNSKELDCNEVMKSRGYYSEPATNLNYKLPDDLPGTLKYTCLLWQVNTEKNAPTLTELMHLRKPKFLAPAERWMSYDEEKEISFPVNTFKPKAQLQHDVDPFSLPRNVSIERKRRQYSSKGLGQCLDEINVQTKDIVPTDIMREYTTHETYGLYCKLNYLPLDLFDNTEFDTRTPEGWLNHGLSEGVRHPIPGEAFLPITEKTSFNWLCDEPLNYLYEWTNVAVLDYNDDDNLWTILTLDGLQRSFILPRIYLMFKAEDPEVFAQRIKAALILRNSVESLIKYEFYIDNVNVTGTYDFDDATYNKILKSATRNKVAKLQTMNNEIVEKIEKEIRLNHKRTLGELQFRNIVLKDPSAYRFLTLPPREIQQIPDIGKIQTGMKHFSGRKEYFQWYSLYVLTEIYHAQRFVVVECMKVQQMCMFTTNIGKFQTLDEFDALQHKVTTNVIKYLTSTWLDTITFNIRMSVIDIGKGWFNVAEKKHEIYDIAKLLRLMELIKFHMQHALRILVENSVYTFLNMVETPCQICLDVQDDFKWGFDFCKSPFKPHVQPIFNVNLKMEPTGAFYSTNPGLFEKVLLSLYHNAITQTHNVKQVHPFLLTHLKFPSNLTLSSVGLLANFIVEAREKFVLGYKKAIIPLNAYAKEYDVHLELYTLDVEDYVNSYGEENHNAIEAKEEISYQYKMKNNLELTLPIHITIGPFYVNVEPLKIFLIEKRLTLAIKLLDQFCLKLKCAVEEILEEYHAIDTKLHEKPQSIENIYDLREWIETIPLTVRGLEESIKRYVLEYDILDFFWYNLPQEDFENKWEAIGSPYHIFKLVEETNEHLNEEQEKFLKIQQSDEYTLLDKIDQFIEQVAKMSALKDFSKCQEISVDMKRAWKAMKDAQEHGQLLNQRQKLFNEPVVPFDQLNKLIKEFEPYKNLWSTAADWIKWQEIWMSNPLIQVDGEIIERNVADMFKTMVKSIRIFADIPAVQHVAMQIKDEIEEFRPLIGLIQALKNPGIRQRHWDELMAQTGINGSQGATLTFNDFLEMGIQAHTDVFLKIGESAGKEYVIEQTLDKMMAEWEANLLDLQPYKKSGTYIVKVSDEIQQMLDDHIVLTQQISFSPYKAAYEQRINEWEERLKITADVLEEWIEVQKQWMYLEPIFTSEDISKQLPVESKKYNSMERSWRRIMRGAKDNPNILEYCPDKKLLESLKDANHMLEVVQKGLTDYLETKRTIFPRLFFLSDDELLEILSQARNPLAVQPHLRKCFENIAKLKFQDDLEITHMFSAEGECVELTPTLYPVGSIENWLVIVESSMKNTIRVILGKSLEQIYNKERQLWVLNWPGQVVIAGSQTFWTAGVEQGIKSNTLKDFFAVLLDNLDRLRGLVKGVLTFLQREVLSALIVIEVHARDVTMTLVHNNVTNINDFDWIAQLRYYWINEQEKVRAVNAEFSYGYEYLGNSGRLVITPLTDRCYLTLTGALHLKFGGAPAGPAGTGKTETTKDLAKAFAIQCVVFNCSDQLDFMAMGKFFKGLASSGAWACFDEFNRIDIEVLSVVAQQMMTIQKAQQARLDLFMFEGQEIVLKESCAVFITMNPGYAGRTELPDNLKALFRPVAMMVPDYTLIAEISLFSFGFTDAKLLANKITTTFKLSSEQLSSQDHYDFGMRAVKTVIAVAGNLKREKPDMDEPQIVLRAIRDVNVPKFLKDDLKLFNGIVSDLFPRMVEQVVDYGALEQSIRSCCITLGLEDVDDYVKKVIQLYETTVVRHGLMLVGPTSSGKTKCYQILKCAMGMLRGTPQPSGYSFENVHTYVLNPKSITMGQLYGEFNLQTHEWTDGILPSLVRIGVAATNDDKRWYVFDGPVDAVWIENMNTVLDDNKKLCLSSGEIIKLKNTQTMMFEVADLAVASPATVSRCGMVYLEPGVLGLQPFLNCWKKRLPPLAAEYGDKFMELFERYLLPSLDLLRTKLKEVLHSVDASLVMNFLDLLDQRLQPLSGKDNRPPPPPQFMKLIPDLLVPWVIFSLIWTVGCTCDNDGRTIFSEWVHSAMDEHEEPYKFPENALVYDFKLHDGGYSDATDDGEPAHPTWRDWLENVEDFKITIDMKYSDIEIPTIDNVRYSFMVGLILNNEKNPLCVGPTGTGKTLTVVGKLSRNMHKKFIVDFINFSARTSSNQTQDLIDSKLDRRRKGVFGPPILKRQIFFIDDFNMPALEVYGAQPPIELIRQWMDFNGWYDRKNIGEFRTIIDVNFAASMGPPGGGRNFVTLRLLRHFHYITFLELGAASKIKIFGSILKFWLQRTENFLYFYEPLLLATIEVYDTILKELLPTPAKTHYTFNLRDLSKVFQGILMVEPEQIKNIEEIIILWYHENSRVFADRLVNASDQNWFDKLLYSKIANEFVLDPDTVLGEEMILFGDFIDPAVDIKLYTQLTDYRRLNLVLENYLEDYNSQTTRPMSLVLFLDAISHVCRISRIIRQPMGNALLLGMGGSGRQSVTILSSHIAEYFCYQIELTKAYGPTEWREDVKQLMLKAGIYRKETVFLFSDTQIKSESFLEDLNNILNSGDVPNIYQPDELDIIYQSMKGTLQEMGLAATKSNLFSVYQKQIRANLHTVISMSPIGEIFRARLRQFPALVNCCTIDWFNAWPDTALQSVALKYLHEIPDLDVTDEILHGIVRICQFMHAGVVDASVLYKAELSRHNYVTPTSYLQLLASYAEMITKRKGSLMEGVHRLKTGLSKLASTAEEVKVLQIELELMKPALEVAKQEAEIMISQIAADTAIAEEIKAKVELEEIEATNKKFKTEVIAEDAQRDLQEALPALLAAEKSLQALNKNDITEVRSMKRPPRGVIYVIESICIVKGVKPNKVADKDNIRVKLDDYWEPGRGMLVDPGQFLNSLLNFDKESITEDMIQKLKKYVDDPSYQPDKIAKVSKACTSLCIWILAMYKYFFVNQAVAPKKAALAQAQSELDETIRALESAKARMAKVLNGLLVLNKNLEQRIAFKEEKESSINLCLERMNRAKRLIHGLADERIRWMDTIAKIESDKINVTGNVLISAGSVAYLTPFTDKYRRTLLQNWIHELEDVKVPHSAKCDPVSILGEPVQIRQWQIDGLPRDYLSTENAILVKSSRRWPLFIDPQGQANKWVKNTGKSQGLSICKLADRDLLRTLESAIRFGKPVLIENVGTELDPALDPILQRNVFWQGGVLNLKLGDAVIPYSEDFQLFITTKLPNPHYTPEISIKVQLVNFTLVPSGLQDQLLGLVVMQERPDLEELRSAIVVSVAQMKQELKEIQDRILYKLSASEGSPLDDIDFIITLESSKIKSDDIKSKVEAAEVTQIDIDNTRSQYIPVANRGQILFFCLSDLANVDPMYQYSLEWFIAIFVGSMADTEKTDDLIERVETINEYLTFNLFNNVCRSLFETHKLMFAFLLWIRILLDINKIDAVTWQYFLTGGNPIEMLPNPAPQWLSLKSWQEVLALKNLQRYEQFVNEFQSNLLHYQDIFESAEPHRMSLPAPFEKQFSDFDKLLVLKALRPDKIPNAIQNFLTTHAGERFVEPQTADLLAMFKESGPTIPLIFVLSAGTDPAADLYKFADRMKMGKRMLSISLGQGQGPIAEKMIANAAEIGSWVFFQNCHLAPSWMPRLDRVIENISPEAVHKEFRIWLTSTPSPHFPVAILQNGSKMTVEPPRGVKANLLRAYTNQVPDLLDFFNSKHEKVPTFKWLLYSLCLFHGVLLERRKFGPLGFNIPYEFTDGDLKMCISQLHMFLLEYEDIPFKVLVYTAGHINYGGRVTDDWDRRCLMNSLADYYKANVVNDHYSFDLLGFYHQIPSESTLTDYVDYVRSCPLNDDPALFGLHSNADITCAQAYTYNTLSTMLSLQPKAVVGATFSQEEETGQVATSLLTRIPTEFDIEAITKKYPVRYEESLNTVIIQEGIRYNKLIGVIKLSLNDLLKALKGLVVMSESLEKMSSSLYSNQVPQLWMAKAYPSLKPLGAWINDLIARCAFLEKWETEGIPPSFWISGFYFPQAFLTGSLQNFARKYIVSIDTLSFTFQILGNNPTERPADGCIIYGLYLEGCRWNSENRTLDESHPKELYTEMKPIWMVPEENHKKPERGVYTCPVYKTLTRAGVLSTTGHSTNYVVAIEIPSNKPEKHWINRGTALICALDY